MQGLGMEVRVLDGASQFLGDGQEALVRRHQGQLHALRWWRESEGTRHNKSMALWITVHRSWVPLTPHGQWESPCRSQAAVVRWQE